MNNSSVEMTVDEVFEKFQKFNKAKNLAKSTIKYYENRYNKFKRFLHKENIGYVHEINS